MAHGPPCRYEIKVEVEVEVGRATSIADWLILLLSLSLGL